MPAEAPVFADTDRVELARRLCRGLYQLWLRQIEGPPRQAPDVPPERLPGAGAGDTPPRLRPPSA